MIVDAIDRRILRALQTDSRQTVAEIGALAGLSPSACHRRIRNLEQAGVIAGYTVEVALRSQSDKALEAFERAVEATPEILECHLMAGGTDYLLRVVAVDAADFERIHRERLARLPHVARLQSHLAIRTVRSWAGYPPRET
jgi:DNA-binding Lrp family transcriptional regulator